MNAVDKFKIELMLHYKLPLKQAKEKLYQEYENQYKLNMQEINKILANNIKKGF